SGPGQAVPAPNRRPGLELSTAPLLAAHLLAGPPSRLAQLSEKGIRHLQRGDASERHLTATSLTSRIPVDRVKRKRVQRPPQSGYCPRSAPVLRGRAGETPGSNSGIAACTGTNTQRARSSTSTP